MFHYPAVNAVLESEFREKISLFYSGRIFKQQPLFLFASNDLIILALRITMLALIVIEHLHF